MVSGGVFPKNVPSEGLLEIAAPIRPVPVTIPNCAFP